MALFGAAVFLIAAPVAEAQTLSLSATPDRDADTAGVQVNEGDTVTITLTLVPALSSGTVATDAVSFGGSARAGEDYSGAALAFDRIFFTNQSISFTRIITADGTPEPDETITLAVPTFTYAGPDIVTRGPDLVITILANDGEASTVTIADAADVSEGGETTFTVTLTGGNPAPSYPVTVTWTAAIGGTLGGTPDPASGSLDFAAGQTTGGITVGIPANTDLGDGDSRTLTVTITPPGGITATDAMGTATVNYITADTTPPQFVNQSNQPGWSGGQSVLWLQVNEDFKVLPHPDGADGVDGATLSAATPGETTLDRRDFTVTENCCAPAMAGADIAVESVEVVTQHRALKLTLANPVAANAQNLQVSYERVGSHAIYDTAVERGLAQNNRRNAMAAETLMLTPNPTADADSDGIPDAAEARILTAAGNPFVDVSEAQQPQFSVSRTDTPNVMAYSGIRAAGVDGHLGYAVTGAQTITAYYRSDTFGYGGTYQCASGQFPANYAAALSDGGCAPVDWGNIAPGTNHTIAWLAQSEDGVWNVDLTTDSNLPEQVIWRIPELNMASQRLFTTGTAVTVRATADDGRTFTSTTSTGGVWTMDELAGGDVSLWRPSATAPLSSQYSVGLSTQTVVVRAPADSVIPPVPGRPVLMRGSDVVNALAVGSAHQLRIPIDNGGVITTETRAIAASEIAGLAGTTTDVSVSLPGGGGSVSAMFRYPVVSATADLASSGDSDGDGIADNLDDFDELAHLPVSATEAVRHIRPVLRSHRLRAGDETLARVTAAAADTVDYNAWQASRFAAGSVVYDFSIYNVGYAAVSSATPAGGTAGVIIPLPRAFRGANVEVRKYNRGLFNTGNGDRYGFANRRAEDGECPDDDGRYTAASGDCLAVYITDGGPNDVDDTINGVIKDPLCIRTAGGDCGSGSGSGSGAGGGSGGGGSGTFGPVTLAVLVMLATLLLSASRLRRRRPT